MATAVASVSLLLLNGCALLPERSRVRVREGAYHYEGAITDELNARLFALESEMAQRAEAAGAPGRPTWLYITSPGGEAHAGVDEYLADVPPEVREEKRPAAPCRRASTRTSADGRAREQRFFAAVGVSPKITTIGREIELEGLQGYQGWRFSAESLRRFGLKDVTVVAPPWEPRQWRRARFHLIRDELIPDEMLAPASPSP
jgi:hypothetical protein